MDGKLSVDVECPDCKGKLIATSKSCDMNMFAAKCESCLGSFVVAAEVRVHKVGDPVEFPVVATWPPVRWDSGSTLDPKKAETVTCSLFDFKKITVTGCAMHEGPSPNPDFSRFTDESRQLFSVANRESTRRNHEYVGTEHILLAITSVPCMARVILMRFLGDFGGSVEGLYRIRGMTVALMQPDGPGVVLGKMPLTPRVRKVIGLASENARLLGKDYVGTEHILDALMLEGGGIAHQVLTESGFNPKNSILQPDSAPLATGLAIKPCPKPACGGDRFVDGYSSTGRMWLTCRSCGTTTPINVGDDGYIPRSDEHR